MPEKHMYLRVGISRIQAVISINTRNENIRTIHCSNMEFCDGFNFEKGVCPKYCQVISEAQKYISGKRGLNADIKETMLNTKLNLGSVRSLVCYN